ncbi:Envelope glycoprotein gp160 [Ophidiomyces ophidiicola]|nr:Envelope glycoprotein gp160 [Ophidiomyces ophidiicola]KAI2378012.1 Envelope glycoprotein gp160 [Ophidiomyces ophidiicola]KAI2409404.1 Envelope glycoprotein gp160 [Ophidiomyces ophidiicola]
MSEALWGCTLETCPVENSLFGYRPSLAANVAFLVLFGMCALVQVVELVRWRRYSFSVLIIFGGICEVIGYAGRIMLYKNPFSQDGFLIQVCCLTIAPSFYSAAIYFCIADIVGLFGPKASRLKPMHYAWIFIPCDFISLVLQGTGGGLASVASQQYKDPKPGTSVMVAGLAFQVFSLLVFILLILEFVWRARRIQSKEFSEESSNEDSCNGGRMLARFVIPFCLAILCIFIRCVFRVAELSNGWTGDLIKHEDTFIALEGA